MQLQTKDSFLPIQFLSFHRMVSMTQLESIQKYDSVLMADYLNSMYVKECNEGYNEVQKIQNLLPIDILLWVELNI